MTRDERGFTLVELLVSMTLGLVVLGAVMNLVSTSQRSAKRVADRVDASQRGRLALNQLQQQIRAMACLPNGTRPIVSATDTQLVFFANLDANAAVDVDGDGDPTFDPSQRRLTVTGTATAPLAITEEAWAATPTAPLPVDMATATPRRRTLVDAMRPLESGQPVFRYYGYATAAANDVTRLPGPVTTPERIARVEVAFTATAANSAPDPRAVAPLSTSVLRPHHAA
jgi:prepilin-type N-terminal cleavage/methylation domain-containing protein